MNEVLERVANAVMEMPDQDPSSLDIARVAIAEMRLIMIEKPLTEVFGLINDVVQAGGES